MFSNIKERIQVQKFFFIGKVCLVILGVIAGIVNFIFPIAALAQPSYTFSEIFFTFPAFFFIIILLIGFITSIFSNAVGGVIHLCNFLLMFGHFWFVLSFVTQNTAIKQYVWIGILVCEMIMLTVSIVLTVLDIIVSCKFEQGTTESSSGYFEQIDK
jgi:hypothetical protein